MRSQQLSHHSEMQLDKAVNRLFDDAGRKKMKLEKMRMENMLTELSATRATPSINENSKSIMPHKQVPLYKRGNAETQTRRRRQAYAEAI